MRNPMGLRHFYMAKKSTDTSAALPTYTGGKLVGKMIKAECSVNTAEGKLYADDMTVLSQKKFVDADLTVGSTGLDMEDYATMCGATYTASTKRLTLKGGDLPAPIGVGYIRVMGTESDPVYWAMVFYNVTPDVPSMQGDTATDSINFGSDEYKMKALACAHGEWGDIWECESEEDADDKIKDALGIT